MQYNIGIYTRLSVEDENKQKIESESILNQKSMIENFIDSKEDFLNSNKFYYADDGYVGTNFERPAFKLLIEDIRNKKINCIIVKDLSRFGRDYIEVNNYLDKVFPFLNVRFIAVNDNYDSNNENSNEVLLMHLKNFMNDIYSRDISKKISTVINEKQKKGEFIGIDKIKNVFQMIWKGDLTLDVEGKIKLGSKAIQKAVLGDDLERLLQNIIGTFNSHTHLGNLGSPTAPPATPMTFQKVTSNKITLE